MNVTLSRLQELAETGLSAEARCLYLTASCWAFERGTRRISTAALCVLPGAPRDSKRLGKLLLELIGAGLIVSGDGWYEVPEKLTAGAARMRRLRANESGTRDEPVQRTDSARVRDACSEQGEHGAEEPPSPPAPPLPDSAGSSSEFSLSAPTLSSGSKPESKPARGAKKPPKKPCPETFDAEIKPRVFEWARGKHYPDWWTADRLEQMRIDCGSKGIMFADWYLGAIGWLNREDKQYGNGPDALLARRQRGGAPPGLEQHNVHKQAQGAAIARRFLAPPTRTP